MLSPPARAGFPSSPERHFPILGVEAKWVQKGCVQLGDTLPERSGSASAQSLRHALGAGITGPAQAARVIQSQAWEERTHLSNPLCLFALI